MSDFDTLESTPIRPATRWAGQSLVYRPTTGSTNDDVRHEIDHGAPHGFCVVAGAQSLGRGRVGRTWYSPEGENLYISTLLHIPEQTPSFVSTLPLCVGLAARNAIAQCLPDHDVRTKWPNDVRVSGQKIAGVLLEGVVRKGRTSVIVAGVGINVNTRCFPDELRATATSMAVLTRTSLDRRRVLEVFLTELESAFDQWVREPINAWLAEFAHHCDTLGARIVASNVSGVAIEIQPDGSLLVEADDGKRHTVTSEIAQIDK